MSRPVELITGLSASTDHNSGRLVVGPDQKLYYSIGDQGNNQFERFCNPTRARICPPQQTSVTGTGQPTSEKSYG